ncbi:hypothetical protein ACEWY4_007087 [Coilia grayii]|uniref:DUF4806 domain-containing protein n=1 Tax=Coilia grayii TaxID=363190 RepID=A0ABD1KFJ8_9TELE
MSPMGITAIKQRFCVPWEAVLHEENYEEGRRKAREAEHRSDLQSDTDMTDKRPNRKRMRSVRLAPLGVEVESEEEDDGPPLPKRNPPALAVSAFSLNPTPVPATVTPTVLPPVPTVPDFSVNHTPVPATLTPTVPATPTPIFLPPVSDPKTFTQLSPLSEVLSWEPGRSAPSLLREVLTKLEMVLDQQSTILQIIQRQNASPTISRVEGLPMVDMMALQALEQSLQSEEEIDKLINYLGVIGGMNTKDCVWKMMGRVFTNELARNLNWRGINGKVALSKLKIKDIITRAVRKNPLASGASESDVESVMKRWLQLAADREGGRKRRMLE